MMHMPSSHFGQQGQISVAGPKEPRRGLLKMRIGARFQQRGGDGTVSLVEVLDGTRIASPLKTTFRCLHVECKGKEWKSHAAMVQAHPTLEVMTRQEETHVFGQWCDEIPTKDDQGNAVVVAGFLSDEG